MPFLAFSFLPTQTKFGRGRASVSKLGGGPRETLNKHSRIIRHYWFNASVRSLLEGQDLSVRFRAGTEEKS
jgi:hypothetical protein